MPIVKAVTPETHEKALRLLRAGVLMPGEVASRAGVSRQLVNHWLGELDWRSARQRYADQMWKHHTKTLKLEQSRG